MTPVAAPHYRLRMRDSIPWRRVAVTGAASGIGRCFAEVLAERGAEVAALDVSAAGLEAVARDLAGRGRRVFARAVDVADGEEVRAAFAAVVGEVGELNLVVHCAAVLQPGFFAEQSAADFARAVRVDLVGTANVARAALGTLQRTRGGLVCVASTAAVHGWPGLSAYSAAKFGVAGFCDALRAELAPAGVCFTTVFPLLIDTPLLQVPDLPPILRRGRRLPPRVVVEKTLAAAAQRQGRVYVPEVVRVIAFLHGAAPCVLDWVARRFGLPG